MIESIRKHLIVSCQALKDEPLYSSFIMSKMALAAQMGGAKGIRANSVDDITEIKRTVNLPIIGIIKKDYDDSDVYITPTISEVDDLVKTGCEIIAMDATSSLRPNNIPLDIFFKQVREKYSNQLFMADCSTIEEAINADKLGFDFIGTTLVGYTSQSHKDRIEAEDFKIIREIIKNVSHPVIAEGNIDTPEKARRVLDLGCYSVVVGSIITRPQVITKRFTDMMNELMDKLADKMLPVAQKMSDNRYLSAIRNAFVTVMPIIIGCSIFTLLNSVLLGKGNYLDKWFGIQCNELVNMGGAIVSAGTGEMKKRYGFVYVDRFNDGHGTLERKIKKSYYHYKEIIETNGECLIDK